MSKVGWFVATNQRCVVSATNQVRCVSHLALTKGGLCLATNQKWVERQRGQVLSPALTKGGGMCGSLTKGRGGASQAAAQTYQAGYPLWCREVHYTKKRSQMSP